MDTDKKHLAGLNNEQREAALHMKGPLLIVAGAGAGKTKTITHRIVNLIKEGVPPEKILAVTFTNKAAKEMRERVLAALEQEISRERGLSQADEPRVSAPPAGGDSDPERGKFPVPFVSTFHSLGVYIIKENARALGLTKYFTILDEGDALAMIKEIEKELGLDPKQYEPRKIKAIISREKGKFTHLSDFAEREEGGMSSLGKIVAQVWNLYEKRKVKENALDFDDLLLKSAKLLKDHPEIRKIYQERWEYVHIDEYQDTNEVQYLMSKLLSENNNNIAVVGDTDQCLVVGTKIKMADNTLKPIEDVKKGEFVLSNYGSGDFRPAEVVSKKSLLFKGNLIRIETKKGKVLTSTPEHIHFAGYRLGITPQTYLNYLMYKNGVGWRIGTTSVYTNGQKKSVAGFMQRSNQEHADAVWIIATHKTQQEARVQEYIFSLKYQIPTIPFTARKGLSKNGYVHDHESLKKIFSFFSSKDSALQLLSDIGLSLDHPHHQPQVHNANRRNINITLCADKRGKTPMHLISTFGNDEIGRKKLESLGLSVRLAKKDTQNWRFETARSSYGEISILALKIASVFPGANLIFSARLGGMKNRPKDGNSLPHIQASSVMPGMAIFTEDGYDIVYSVSRVSTSKVKVFDLDIVNTHNFIANDILTHNCIYSWRGANLKNILSFEKDYPNAKIVLLEKNYRSTKNILEAANEIIKKNKYRPDKNLFTDNEIGDKIGLYEAIDETDEADFIATKILEIIDKGSAPAEIAVLYRANFQSRVLEEAMLRYNIPYQVLGVKFFERKEIKDTLAYLRAALNLESLSDIKRIINFPARGIGKATLAKLFAGQKEELPIKIRLKVDNFYAGLEEIKAKISTDKASDVVKFVVKRSGIETELQNGGDEELERLENIKELATLALKYDNLGGGAGVEKLLEDASLASDQDSLMINSDPVRSSRASGPADSSRTSATSNGVKLMTVHAAKGLEFKYVFVTGLESGLFPHERQNERETNEDREEERRLFYVAVTRAKEKLLLTFANFRTIFGSRNINAPSEFIADIPADLLEREGEDSGIKTIYI